MVLLDLQGLELPRTCAEGQQSEASLLLCEAQSDLSLTMC